MHCINKTNYKNYLSKVLNQEPEVQFKDWHKPNTKQEMNLLYSETRE